MSAPRITPRDNALDVRRIPSPYRQRNIVAIDVFKVMDPSDGNYLEISGRRVSGAIDHPIPLGCSGLFSVTYRVEDGTWHSIVTKEDEFDWMIGAMGPEVYLR